MAKPKFREDKATQAAALLLSLNGGRMNHLKLMKLLYIAEREALLSWRRPIVFDCYVSMNFGPVLSQTLNVINGEIVTDGTWVKCISPRDNNEVRLLNNPGLDTLSDAEEQLLREIFKRYESLNQWQLCDITHDFPEWTDPKGSSIPIQYHDILQGAGKTPTEIATIIDELDNLATMDFLMG